MKIDIEPGTDRSWIDDFHKAIEDRKEPPPTPPPASTATNPYLHRPAPDWVKRMEKANNAP